MPKGLGLGVSIKAEEKAKDEDVDPDAYMLGKEDVADEFTQEDVDKICFEFLENIKQHQSLYATLKSNKAMLKEGFILELHVYNQAQKSVLSDKLFDLVKLLRTRLNNYKLKAIIKIIENENSHKPTSPVERYNLMVEKNPNLKKLKDDLNLELDL